MRAAGEVCSEGRQKGLTRLAPYSSMPPTPQHTYEQHIRSEKQRPLGPRPQQDNSMTAARDRPSATNDTCISVLSHAANAHKITVQSQRTSPVHMHLD